MTYICRAAGCASSASTEYGRYCRSHVAQLRRHGAIGQTGVTKAELKLYRHIVQTRLEKNKGKNLWDNLETRWKALVSLAEGVMAESRAGKAMVRFRREAAQEVLSLNNAANLADVIETFLAMYVMEDQDPRRFKSDTAFRTQLVRRVRGVTARNADTWKDAKTGKEKRVYRDLAPRTVAVMGQWFAEYLGDAGIHFAKLERRDHERQQRELLDYRQALGGME